MILVNERASNSHQGPLLSQNALNNCHINDTWCVSYTPSRKLCPTLQPTPLYAYLHPDVPLSALSRVVPARPACAALSWSRASSFSYPPPRLLLPPHHRRRLSRPWRPRLGPWRCLRPHLHLPGSLHRPPGVRGEREGQTNLKKREGKQISCENNSYSSRYDARGGNTAVAATREEHQACI